MFTTSACAIKTLVHRLRGVLEVAKMERIVIVLLVLLGVALADPTIYFKETFEDGKKDFLTFG